MTDELSKKFKDHFGSRLKKIREESGLSRNKVSELTGLAISTLQTWENGDRMPNALDIHHLARVYNVSEIDLFTHLREAPKNRPIKPIETETAEIKDVKGNPIDINEFCFIPRYNVYASAGHGCDVSQETYMHSMAFRKYWIDNVIGVCVKDLIVIGVRGDSMEGEINDGDVILINTADKHLNNGIYVIRIDGDLIVKRIQKLPGNKIEVSSTNNVYRPFEIDLSNQPNDFGAIGRVVWHGRNVP